MSNLPDFIIVGAMKCGTTTLAAQLAEQDSLFMTTPKEPNFFSDDACWDQGLDWYQSLFAAAAPGDLKGEASTHYTKLATHPHTIDRMVQVLDHPRIIYMIRNPVERAISHYIHEWSQGNMGNDPVEAFRTHSEIVSYGQYGMQIAPYIEQFGAHSVFLTSLEQLKTDPQGELDRIGTFLGRSLVWQETIGAQNVSAARARKLPLHGLLVDNPVATVLRRTLVPKSVRTRIREARQMTDRPQLPDALYRTIEAEFMQDWAMLAELFPEHPALDLCYPFAT